MMKKRAVIFPVQLLGMTAALAGALFSNPQNAPAPATPPAAPSQPETIVIDPTGPTHTFPHFWDRMFGSGRAILTLRESYRNDLRMLKKNTGAEYVRFHNIFHDENGVFDLDANGLANYNFTYVDQIYDGMIDNGFKPFVELSFMPKKLAANPEPHPFWYKPYPSPPNDYRRWDAMILAFTRHLIDRYGLGEVQNWYFEVWNEPNIDFWNGVPKEETYWELYDHTVSSIKAISPKLRVGGPATAQAAWVTRFLAHCAQKNVPIDFVSSHVYGNDSAENVFGTHEQIGQADMVARAVRKLYDEVKHSAFPNLEIHWSEYNATYLSDVEVTDSNYMGPWLARTIAKSDGLTTSMSYWAFSDVFEEQGVAKLPFYGGYGLIAVGGIPKAAFNAFALFAKLGTERIENQSENTIVTRRPDGTIVIALWNYVEAHEQGENRDFLLDFRNIPEGAKATITVIDRDHGSPLRTWQEMGSPHFPTREEQARLRLAGALPAATPLAFQEKVPVSLGPKTLALIEVSR